MSLFETFNKETMYSLKDTLGKQNIFEVPKIDKIVVSIWIGSLVTRNNVRDFSDLEKNLVTITWQKPSIVKAKRSVASFKLRQWMPVMLKVTLRRQKAYDFIEKLVKLVLPRVRDFDWLSPKKFDGRWNYNLALESQVVFPEITPDDIITSKWIQVNINTTTDDNYEAQKLLESLGIIFNK